MNPQRGGVSLPGQRPKKSGGKLVGLTDFSFDWCGFGWVGGWFGRWADGRAEVLDEPLSESSVGPCVSFTGTPPPGYNTLQNGQKKA